MIRKLVKHAAFKFRIASEKCKNVSQIPSKVVTTSSVNALSIEKPNIKSYLFSEIIQLDYLGPAELNVIDVFFSQLPDEEAKIDNAKSLVEFFSKFPEKARLISSSYYYLLLNPFSVSSHIIFIAANYSMGRASLSRQAANTLAQQWPNSLTIVILARVLRECEGLEAEYRILEQAYQDRKDIIIFYNLISNLIDSSRVEEANAAIETIRPIVEKELADEIFFVKQNQAVLEEAIQKQLFAPEGDNDIYNDKMCLDNWTSYYESFVTRREHIHGDRLIINHFLRWCAFH